MAESTQDSVTVYDFSAICRICLQSHDDMVDIFGSGIDAQFMEITKLKVKMNDALPKSLCRNCMDQMVFFTEFQEKAKSSDVFLRSLLTRTKTANTEGAKSPISNIKRKAHKKKLRFSSGSRHSKRKKKKIDLNKMYLIVVPKANDSDIDIPKMKNEICIKDVTNDNSELIHYCKNVIDHSYQKNQSEFNENSCLISKKKDNEKDKLDICTFKVNLFIYECTECEASFDEDFGLSSHYLLTHNCEEPFIQKFTYECPVCADCEIDKNDFLTHLRKHKEYGCQFLKVNGKGQSVALKDSEKDIFSLSDNIERNNVSSKIVKLSLSTISCSLCKDKIQSEQIMKHLSSCHDCVTGDKSYFIKYRCPVCKVIYLDKKDDFLQHLIFHQKDNFHFIKVNNIGEPVETKEDEKCFVPWNEAIDILSAKEIFTIIDINSCDKCDYAGESHLSLNEHYFREHSEIQLSETNLSCPACHEEFKADDFHDIKLIFYQHLKSHKRDKNQGIFFVEISKTGKIKNANNCHFGIFTQSAILLNIYNGSLTLNSNGVCYPEIFCLGKKFYSDNENGENEQAIEGQREETIVDFFPGEPKQKTDCLNYICEKCGKTFANKLSYNKHFATHLKVSGVAIEGSKRHVCIICNKTFANRTTLSCHLRHHVSEGNGNIEQEPSLAGIICEECGKIFYNRASLGKHKRVHRTRKENTVLKCEICNREFFHRSSFDRHKSAHLNPKYFDCDVCKLPLSSAVSLQRHAELHKTSSITFDCKACKTSFLTRDSLTAHQTHTGHYLDRKPFECNVCHEKFYIGREYTKHIKSHPKYKMGECTLCGKRLATVQSLMLHMGRHFESNSILCPHCGKQFFEEKNYHRHLLTHEGIKPFACDFDGCAKSFYTLFEVNRHKKYHSNTRDFECPYCKKSFHEANHLTVHVRTHTGERPYVCPHCNKGFITRTRCKNHIKLVHQGIGYDLIQSSISKKVAVFEAVEAPV